MKRVPEYALEILLLSNLSTTELIKKLIEAAGAGEKVPVSISDGTFFKSQEKLV